MNLNQLRKEKEQIQNRIQGLQEKLSALESKETEMENSEILKTVCALNLKPSQLDELLVRLKRNPFTEIHNIPAWEPEKDEE
jgi:prefoldin subunit 5